MSAAPLGKIITFYSYKGGTGRSMALANVAWILASRGKRVLVVDWDLEAPGLHRYFHPFLLDKELGTSEGVIDCVIDFITEAVTPNDQAAEPDKNWYKPYANILRYAVPLEWQFPDEGMLDFIPAGSQGPSYSTRVNSFNWEDFYQRFGGGAFLEAVKENMRKEYDYILIDSRTGVSDTSGICTVQMPDMLVICFTLNNQSIDGAAGIAESVQKQRGASGMRIFPIPSRVDLGEKEKLERAREYMRQKFNPFLWHIQKEEQELYWGKVETLYYPFYAYEEILATFGDKPGQTNSLLASMERITTYLTDRTVSQLEAIDEAERQKCLSSYVRQALPSFEEAKITEDLFIPFATESAFTTQEPFFYVSYSSADGQSFALQLADTLEAGEPAFNVWLDKRNLIPGQEWDVQIAEAIRKCDALLFVMTPDSVTQESLCEQEWMRALKYKKLIIPVLAHPGAEMPFRLGTRRFVDFTQDFEQGLARLQRLLQERTTPKGELRALKERLADAQRDQRRVTDAQLLNRIEEEIAELQQKIVEQQRIVDDPERAAKRTEQSIKRGIERERFPQTPIRGLQGIKFINPPPVVAPAYFQGRTVETALVAQFLADESTRIISMAGRGGIGKTALICRLLKSLERGVLPDDGGELSVDGIVYLSTNGSRRVNLPNLYTDLCQFLPETIADDLNDIYKNPRVSTIAKMQSLLQHFPSGRYVVLLDNFEDVIDTETQTIKDAELVEALIALLEAPHHGVKVIITTRILPQDLIFTQPGRQGRVDLDEGLPSPYAENILREMDASGRIGLRDADPALLDAARERTRGYPRALEALFAILAADRSTTLAEILADTSQLPENVMRNLVGEAFSRLDSLSQQVMQALAIYGRPVTAIAVDHLLQPYLSGINSTPTLNRLVNMRFANKESGRYYLHPVDRAYVLSQVPEGTPTDRSSRRPCWTQVALLHRGADYFQKTRKPNAQLKTLDDLTPQLAEFELRYAGGDYDTAAGVLNEISFDYLFLWGYYRLLTELHARLQNHLKDPSQRSSSLTSLGNAYASLGDYHRAIDYYQQSLAIVRKLGNHHSEGSILGNLGNAYAVLGEIRRAMECYQQAYTIAHRTRNRQGESVQLGNLGQAYATLGDIARAVKYYEQALSIAHEIHDRQGESVQLGNLGQVYATLGDIARAVKYYEQALSIAREIGDLSNEGTSLRNLGLAYASLGDIHRGIEFSEQALKIADKIGDRRTESMILSNLGHAYAYLGDTAQAIDFYQQALALAREIGDRHNEGQCLANLSEVLIDIDHYEEAMQPATQSVEIADEISSPNLASYGHTYLALISLYSGAFTAARAAIELATKYNQPSNNYYVSALWGLITLRMGDEETAQKAFQSAVMQADQLLEQNKKNYSALDTKGLALSGLSLLQDNQHLDAAREAYHEARTIIKVQGIVGRVLRLLDVLMVADESGTLEDIRTVAAGAP